MSMFDVSRVSVEVGGTEISFETGKLAKQASGSVVVQAGDTMVLSTATAGNLRDVDFPAADGGRRGAPLRRGQDPGLVLPPRGESGREGDADRAHDRPAAAPAVPEGLAPRDAARLEPMSVDHVHPYDILAMNGASAALAISDIPVAKHVGAVRVGKLEGDFVVNPPRRSARRSSSST